MKNRLTTDPHVLALMDDDDTDEGEFDWSQYRKGSEQYARLLLQMQASLPADQYAAAVRALDSTIAIDQLNEPELPLEI